MTMKIKTRLAQDTLVAVAQMVQGTPADKKIMKLITPSNKNQQGLYVRSETVVPLGRLETLKLGFDTGPRFQMRAWCREHYGADWHTEDKKARLKEASIWLTAHTEQL